MTGHIRRAAEVTVRTGNLLHAAWYILLTLLYALAALWLMMRESWVWFALGGMLAMQACAFFKKGCDIFLAAMPHQTPQEREQWLNARGLYIPRPRNSPQHGKDG